MDLNAAQLAGWDYVLTVPAEAEDEYSAIVPTLADSTGTTGSGGNYLRFDSGNVGFLRNGTAINATGYESLEIELIVGYRGPPPAGDNLKFLDLPPT